MTEPVPPPGTSGSEPTSSPHRPLGYPLNPDYGNGACIRRVVLNGREGCVDATLTDDFHEFSCTVLHDGGTVIDLIGHGIRVPTSACPASSALLGELIGLPLGTSGAVFYGSGRARRHCTHLYDLAIFAIGHARRGPGRRVYEAIVPDETDAPIQLEIRANGMLIHCWTVRDGKILKPAALAGLSLGQGMAQWASRLFENERLEAATILARTWLIAVGRRYLVETAAGKSISLNSSLTGSCYAYDPMRAKHAVFSASIRRP